MSSKFIRGNPEAELERLSATNFFRDKPPSQSKAGYLHDIACKEAKRFGTLDPLADHYIRVAAYARMVGA